MLLPAIGMNDSLADERVGATFLCEGMLCQSGVILEVERSVGLTVKLGIDVTAVGRYNTGEARMLADVLT